MKFGIWGGSVILAVLLPVAGAIAQLGEIEVSEIPEPVQAAVAKRFASAKIVGAAREQNEAGKPVYEIAVDNGGKNVDLTLTPEGAFVTIQKSITRKELPAPVLKTLESKFQKVRYRSYEECYEVDGEVETLAHYEVIFVNADKQVRAVQFDPEGKVLGVEKLGAEGEEDE